MSISKHYPNGPKAGSSVFACEDYAFGEEYKGRNHLRDAVITRRAIKEGEIIDKIAPYHRDSERREERRRERGDYDYTGYRKQKTGRKKPISHKKKVCKKRAKK